MTKLFLLMFWLNGSWTPLVYDAYESREQCMVEAAQLNSSKLGFAGCPSVEVVRAR